MKTLKMLGENLFIPMATGWLLANLAEYRGKQELFTRQSPQKLKALREHALIESAVSSNRIEGVEVDPDRIKILMLGTPTYKDRNEEEFAGYRSALNWIHSEYNNIPLSELEAACPGVSREWIQTILGALKKNNRVVCAGKGRGARWTFLGE